MDDPSQRSQDQSSGTGGWSRLLPVRDDEWRALLWSVVFHFCILAGYYIIRPVRDEIGAAHRDHLQVLWTAVFFVMLAVIPLYTLVASARHRRVFLPGLYLFFVLNVLIFYTGLANVGGERRVWLEYSFYIWCSVFNLFAVTAFWGFMADVWRNEQSRRLFGIIAVGGSLGGVTGPFVTQWLVGSIGRDDLLLIAAALLGAAAFCAWRIDRLLRSPDGEIPVTERASAPSIDEPARMPITESHDSMVTRSARVIGAVFSSPYLLAISAFLLLYSLGSTFLYFEKTHLIGEAIVNRDERTAFLARIDLYVNLATMLVQCFLLARIIRTIGIGPTLIIRPLITMLGFAALGASLLAHARGDSSEGIRIVFLALVLFEVVRRAGNYALAKPTREILFTVIAREQKYKSKAFIDTVVYRGSDMVNGWFFNGLLAVGLSLAVIAFTAVPFAAVSLAIGLWLGRRQDQLARAASDGSDRTA